MRVRVEGLPKEWASGFENFVPSPAHHFYLVLPAKFSQPGAQSFSDPCKLIEGITRVCKSVVSLSFALDREFPQHEQKLHMEREVITECEKKQNDGEPKAVRSAKNHLRGATGLRVRRVLRHDGCHQAGLLVQGRELSYDCYTSQGFQALFCADMLC